MFGSKLRSWMETHITRPRKKSNKHKQQQCEANGNGNANTNGKKSNLKSNPKTNSKSKSSPVLTSSGGSHSGCGSVIASPQRRREVSPIQCHTPSRYGWQSPDQDQQQDSITSPKSDNLLYAPPSHSYAPRQLPDKSPIKVNCSSSSISSLSWSTGSKDPSLAKQAEPPLPRSYAIIDYQVGNREEEAEYEEVGALLLRPQPPLPTLDYQRPLSENMASDYRGRQLDKDGSHVRYGRLLPSKLVAQVSDSDSSLAVQSEGLNQLSNPLNGRLRSTRGLPRSNVKVNRVSLAPPKSLSSPESAYSTGYSTDGNSPCASTANYNPPEYYINMRTGTHYFPKSVNSLAIEAQRYKFGLNRIEEMSPLDPLPKSNFGNVTANHFGQLENCPSLSLSASPLALRHATPKLFESPSPRQRCRIRTNPWYSTGECAATFLPTSNSMVDATSTSSTVSSGIKEGSSGNELEALANRAGDSLAKAYESSEGSSSSTEVENLHARASPHSPHTIKRRQAKEQQAASEQGKQQRQLEEALTLSHFIVSDDEATLNEMIGKFDESYVYEKETDILSSEDSNATDCPSELDTGQDAGDECDTDELLDIDIDFIDTSSMQEDMVERHNLGSCCYYPPSFERRSSVRSRRSLRSNKAAEQQQQQKERRKRFLKTRKKSCENREREKERERERPLTQRPRESRSVGGTPVCLRRNPKPLSAKERIYKTSPLSQRCNSLVFGANEQQRHFMTIAESEKALLKADLEADMKYRQLIMEAESLLESMKNSLQSIPRDTPVASPRRVNPLANKRVEMLKNSEVDNSAKKQVAQPKDSVVEHELAAAINKRIELLKFETNSPPNSPKMGRCSPRKTHLTNFMNQNMKIANEQPLYQAPPLSPQLQLNGRRLQSSPLSSPRRQMAQSPAMISLSLNCGSDCDESELECISVEQERERQSTEDMANHNYLQPEKPVQLYNNNNNDDQAQLAVQGSFYCPHSEPLKRKVYKGSSSFERIKKSFDLELDMRQQTNPHGHGFPSERQQSQSKLVSISAKSSMHDVTMTTTSTMMTADSSNRKQQLIHSTIVDLKRSLEHQSYELSGLNGD